MYRITKKEVLLDYQKKLEDLLDRSNHKCYSFLGLAMLKVQGAMIFSMMQTVIQTRTVK